MFYSLKKRLLKINIKINIKIKIRNVQNYIPILKGIFLIVYPLLIKKSEKERRYFTSARRIFVKNS